jgi:hypothetical protein
MTVVASPSSLMPATTYPPVPLFPLSAKQAPSTRHTKKSNPLPCSQLFSGSSSSSSSSSSPSLSSIRYPGPSLGG